MNYPKSLFEGRGGFVWLWQSDGDPATWCNILRFEGRGSLHQVFETGCWQNICKVKGRLKQLGSHFDKFLFGFWVPSTVRYWRWGQLSTRPSH